MRHRPTCRSCRHCSPPEGMQMGWCQLRQLAIHPDLVGELWCHHWTARPARLPVVAPHSDGLADATAGGNRQLTLAALLPQH